MDNETTRRRFLVGIATLGSAGATSAGQRQAQPACSSDLLPALRARFGELLHPDVRAVRVTERDRVLCLEMVVGPNAAWAGAFSDFNGMHSCSELTVVNELTCPLDLTDLSPSDSLEESARRLLTHPELEVLCRMIGLISRDTERLYPTDKVAR